MIYLVSSLFYNRGTKISGHDRLLLRFYALYAIPTETNSNITIESIYIRYKARYLSIRYRAKMPKPLGCISS
jgi:hypothetical protein